MTKDQQDLYDHNIVEFLKTMELVGGCPILLFDKYKEFLKICSLNGIELSMFIKYIEK